MEGSSAKDKLKEEFIGRKVRVLTKNNRIFQGKLMCVDYKANLILHQAVAQVVPELNCPLNYELDNIYDQKLIYVDQGNGTEQQKAQRKKEYFGSHYYFGAIMVTGSDITQILMSTQQVNKAPNKQASQSV